MCHSSAEHPVRCRLFSCCWYLRRSHAQYVLRSTRLPLQVQVDVGYITTAVSDRVAHYVSSVLSVPGVTNTQMEAFLSTSTIPLGQVGYNQSETVRNTSVSFLAATASGAALLYLDKDVELYMGMADGMVSGWWRWWVPSVWLWAGGCCFVDVSQWVRL